MVWVDFSPEKSITASARYTVVDFALDSTWLPVSSSTRVSPVEPLFTFPLTRPSPLYVSSNVSAPLLPPLIRTKSMPEVSITRTKPVGACGSESAHSSLPLCKLQTTGLEWVELSTTRISAPTTRDANRLAVGIPGITISTVSANPPSPSTCTWDCPIEVTFTMSFPLPPRIWTAVESYWWFTVRRSFPDPSRISSCSIPENRISPPVIPVRRPPVPVLSSTCPAVTASVLPRRSTRSVSLPGLDATVTLARWSMISIVSSPAPGSTVTACAASLMRIRSAPPPVFTARVPVVSSTVTWSAPAPRLTVVPEIPENDTVPGIVVLRNVPFPLPDFPRVMSSSLSEWISSRSAPTPPASPTSARRPSNRSEEPRPSRKMSVPRPPSIRVRTSVATTSTVLPPEPKWIFNWDKAPKAISAPIPRPEISPRDKVSVRLDASFRLSMIKVSTWVAARFAATDTWTAPWILSVFCWSPTVTVLPPWPRRISVEVPDRVPSTDTVSAPEPSSRTRLSMPLCRIICEVPKPNPETVPSVPSTDRVPVRSAVSPALPSSKTSLPEFSAAFPVVTLP